MLEFLQRLRRRTAPPCDIAFLQMEGVHEDLSAGFLRGFAGRGLRTNVHFNRRIVDRRGDFFATVAHPHSHIDYMQLERARDWDRLARTVADAGPCLLLFNTLQRDSVADWAMRFDLPVFGVVHNPALFRDAERCRALAARGRLELFGLAPHVVDAILREVPEMDGHVHLHNPYDWMPEAADGFRAPGVRLDIVIPGAVDYRNRAFEPLLDYLSTADLSGVRPFRLVILAGGPDRAAFEVAIAARGLQDRFDLEPLDPVTGRVPHERLLQRYYRSDAFLLLLPTGRKDYLTSKVTTGIMAAIGCARPVIAPQIVARAYGIEPVHTPPDRPFELSGADLSDANLTYLRGHMCEVKARGLAQNDAILDPLIGRYLDGPATG